MIELNDIIQFAQQHGYSNVEYIGKWRGYDCYDPIMSENGLIPRIGLPLFIIVEDNNTIRMSTSDEAFKRIDEKYLTNGDN